MDGKWWLKVAAGLSFFMAACQALISVWPAAATYFQAPPSLLNDRVQLFLVGGTAALVPVLVVLGVRPGPLFPAGAGTHLIFLSAGIAYLGGAVLNWKTLRSC